MPGQNHIHKVRKRALGKLGKYLVYACTFPDCTFYLQVKLYIGKETICWGCGKTFKLTGFPSDMPEKPRCGNCKRNRKPESVKEIATEKAVEELLSTPEVVKIDTGSDDVDWDDLLPKLPKL